jgi:ribosomal protein L30/L7E
MRGRPTGGVKQYGNVDDGTGCKFRVMLKCCHTWSRCSEAWQRSVYVSALFHYRSWLSRRLDACKMSSQIQTDRNPVGAQQLRTRASEECLQASRADLARLDWTRPRHRRREVVQLGQSATGRPIRGRTGDTLVYRRKGIPGTTEGAERTLRSLGLRRWGDGRIGFRKDKCFWGQVLKVIDAVTIVDIGSPEDRLFGERPMTANIEKYGERESPGEFLLLDNGEYLQAERSGDFTTLIWTTAMSPGDVVSALTSAAGDPPDESRGLVRLSVPNEDGSDVADGSSADICEYVQKSGLDIAVFNVDLGGFTFAWRSPAPRLEGFSSALAECGVAVSSGHYDVIQTLVRTTATRGISSSSPRLLNRLHLLNRLE